MAFYERDRQSRAARRATRLLANIEASRSRYDRRQYDGSQSQSEEE
jgi:hypothetical protein